MQRRIEQADRGRQAFERPEHAFEIFALIRQQFGERLFAVAHVVGQDHFAHGVDAIAFEEHVLGAAQADAFGAERDGVGDLIRLSALVRTAARDFRAPVHQLS